MSKLDIQWSQNQDVLLLKIAGALDTDTADLFDESLSEKIGQGYKRFIVDMAELEYISSAGIGVLVGSLNELQDNDGNLFLLHLPDKISQVLDMLALLELFSTFDDKNVAFAAHLNT